VAFLDADDYWAPDCLCQLKAALEAADADIAYCGWQNVGLSGPRSQPYVPPDYDDEDKVYAFLRSCPWPIHAALVRRSVLEALGGFAERRFTSMDYDLWMRTLAVVERMVLVPKVLAFYRWHDLGQISRIKWRQVLDAWEVRRTFLKSYPALVSHLDRDELIDLVDGQVLNAGIEAYWKRDLESAHRLLRVALRTHAWKLAHLRYLLPSLLPARLYRAIVTAADKVAAN
jgi:hypothetical protein